MTICSARNWRPWILGWVFVALLGLQVIKSSHHHESAALEEACAVCQLVANNPLDVGPPAAAPLTVVLLFVLLLVHRHETVRLPKARCASYSPQAPPYRAA